MIRKRQLERERKLKRSRNSLQVDPRGGRIIATDSISLNLANDKNEIEWYLKRIHHAAKSNQNSIIRGLPQLKR